MQPIIQVSAITKTFGEFRALNAVSLDVAAGEKIVVCGPSGSGKSTLIRCINRLEAHDSGAITVDGVTLDDRTADRVRREVGSFGEELLVAELVLAAVELHLPTLSLFAKLDQFLLAELRKLLQTPNPHEDLRLGAARGR